MEVQVLADEKILDILRKDSQKGIVLLMEKYTGLIWHVVSFYIENPEDIKECINDTFSRFYFQRKRFDPGKASLSVYLSAIARKLAVSRYRKERIRRAEPLGEEMMQEDQRLSGTELRVDIERAMNMLKPNELQIIRMKYYDGMTVREIAESLKIPYETAKKRHQRSILKLGQSLLLLIVLLLSFSVCVYGFLRCFHVISSGWTGWGQVEPEEIPIGDDDDGTEGIIIRNDLDRTLPDQAKGYKSEDEAEDLILEIPDDQTPKASLKELEEPAGGTASSVGEYMVSPGYGINRTPGEPVYSLADRVFYDGEEYTLTLEEAVYLNNKVTVTAMLHMKMMMLAEDGTKATMPGSGRFRLGYGGSIWENNETIIRDLDEYTRLLTICFEDVTLPASEQGLKALTMAEEESVSFAFDMRPVRQEALAAHPYQIGEHGGVLAVPRIEEGSLIIAIYPLDNEDGYRMLPALVRDSYGSWAGECVTVTGGDGTVLTGECMYYSPRNARTYYEWDFGEAAPGNYTLSIPVIYQESSLDQEFAIPLDLKGNTWEEQEYPVPGGSVCIKECTPLNADGAENIPARRGRLADFAGPEGKRWRLRIGFSSEDSMYSVAGFYGAYCYIRDPGEQVLSRSGIQMTLDSIDIEDQVVEYTLETDADIRDLEDACIRFHSDDIIVYRWNPQFEIPLSVN